MRRLALLLGLLALGCASDGGSGTEPDPDPVQLQPTGPPPDVRFRVIAGRADVPEATVHEGHARLVAWLDEHPDTPLAEYNGLPSDLGGPPPGIEWARARVDLDEFVALIDPPFDLWDFRREDLEGAAVAPDQEGYAAAIVRMKEARRADFARFTGANAGRPLAIVVDDAVLTAPVIDERLEGIFAIVADFGEPGAAGFVASLQLPPLALETGE